MKFKVKDITLAGSGKLKIDWAEKEMPVLRSIKKDFEKRKPFKGLKLAACLHITKETAVLLLALKAGGAQVAACGSNPLSTQDDVAAALAKAGINIYAWRGVNNKDYYWCLEQVLGYKPAVTIDDGADLISLIHQARPELLKTVWAGQEETTTGVIRLKSMAKGGALKYPVVAINNAQTKHLFDNFYGTGQSTIDGLLRTTNILIPGKIIAVAGYGQCSSGIAHKAKGLGARVIVTEVNPLLALKAVMDGFEVMPMLKAAKIADVFITATGNRDIIRKEHLQQMKDGVILGNSGHFNVEINLQDLKQLAAGVKTIRDNLEEYQLKSGKKVFLVGEGRLMNLAAAEGHPSAVMDMSFANQALVCEWLVKNHKNLGNDVYDVPREIDEKVARLKLASLGVKIDQLSKEQEKYLNSWQEGT